MGDAIGFDGVGEGASDGLPGDETTFFGTTPPPPPETPGVGEIIVAPIGELPPARQRTFVGVQPALQGKRLLIVDDNATNRRVLELQSSRWGMISRAASGRIDCAYRNSVCRKVRRRRQASSATAGR